MLAARTRLFYFRLLPLLGLALFITTSSGCATRALMSSDRYEKPDPETEQFRSSGVISRSWHPGGLIFERAYLASLKQEKSKDVPI